MATRVKPSTEKSRTAMRVRGRTDPRWLRQTRRVTAPMETPPGSEISRTDGGREREGARVDGPARRLCGESDHDAADAAEVGREVRGGNNYVARVEVSQGEPRHAVGERLEPTPCAGILQERAHVVPDEAHELGPAHLHALRIGLGHARRGQDDGGAGGGGDGDRRILIGVDQIDHVAAPEAAGVRHGEGGVARVRVGGEGGRGGGEIGPEAHARRGGRRDLDRGRWEARPGPPEILLHDHPGPCGLLRLGTVVAVGADLATRGDHASYRRHHHAEDTAGDHEFGEAHAAAILKHRADPTHRAAERGDGAPEPSHGIVTCPEGCTVTVSENPLAWVTVSTPVVLAVPNGVKMGESPLRLTSLDTAITPALFVSRPIQAAPAQLPWRSCTPPGTVCTQMFCRVWMATMRAWLSAA